MKILVACEYSGIVRDAFIKRGHDALSCDLLPSERHGPHYRGDIMDLLRENRHWDLIIGHPPCTYLCNSGVCWLHEEKGRWAKMKKAAMFFRSLLNADCDRICIENPIMHKYAKEIIGETYSQIIQPWQFGHGETKATCLWLKGLPVLKPTNIVSGREQRIHKMAPSENRGLERSRTFKGIAKAMAEQWGKS